MCIMLPSVFESSIISIRKIRGENIFFLTEITEAGNIVVWGQFNRKGTGQAYRARSYHFNQEVSGKDISSEIERVIKSEILPELFHMYNHESLTKEQIDKMNKEHPGMNLLSTSNIQILID